MSVETQKLEIIEWVLKLKDTSTLDEVMKVKKVRRHKKRGTRKFGSGKTLFTYVADDFDATPAEFRDYIK